MTLLEICVAIGVAIILSFTGLIMTNNQTQLLREQAKLEAYTNQLPAIRATLSKTASRATRARVFTSSDAARTTTDSGITLTNGAALRMNFNDGPNTPANAPWQATLEYRAAVKQLIYRNQDGAEWIVASHLDSVTFAISGGALLLTMSRSGRSADIITSIN